MNADSLPQVHKVMCEQAIRERRCDYKWGVVNSGNAHCVSIHDRKVDAIAWKRDHARAYCVVPVIVIPISEDVLKFVRI